MADIENDKTYLGNGVFADFDGFAIWLTTLYGSKTTNTICVEVGRVSKAGTVGT